MTEHQIAIRRNYRIAMANEIIDDIAYNMTAQQLDVLDFFLKEIKPEDDIGTRYTVSIKEYCSINNIDYRANSTNYNDILASLRAFNNGLSKWVYNAEKHTELLIYWFSMIEVDIKNHTISYNIDNSIAPYLYGLTKKGNFTLHSYRQRKALTSKYAKVLYQWLLRYYCVGIKNPTIPIEKIKVKLGATSYERYADFDRFVIKKAIEQINMATQLEVRYEPHPLTGKKKKTDITFFMKYGMEIMFQERMLRAANNSETFGEETIDFHDLLE